MLGTIVFEPLISSSLWVALALISAVMLGWQAFRRPPAISIRSWIIVTTLAAAGLAALFCILLNPTWSEPIPPPAGKPVVTLLIDRSASMAVTDAAAGTTRYQAASELSAKAARELGSQFETRVWTF